MSFYFGFIGASHLPTVVKPTKTHRLVLRCDNCGMLLFANGDDTQERLAGLPRVQRIRLLQLLPWT